MSQRPGPQRPAAKAPHGAPFTWDSPDAAAPIGTLALASGAARVWQTTRFQLLLDRPRVMGIVNLTPDSFSDGGQLPDVSAALRHCEQLVRDGADLLDLGAESTRPGSEAVPAEQELQRLLPVLRHALTLGVPVSVDTCKPEVMARVLDLGVDIINDVLALRGPGAVELVSRHGRCGVCLMHMQGEPRTMQREPHYDEVVAEVHGFLAQRLQVLVDQGVAAQRVALDPGYGFGKTVEHNLTLQRGQRQLLSLGRPLLVGWSRKSTLGALTGRPVHERLPASLAAALASVEHGADVLRVHDVAATVDALRVWQALR